MNCFFPNYSIKVWVYAIIKSQLNRYEYFTYIKHHLQCAWIVISEILCKKRQLNYLLNSKYLVSLQWGTVIYHSCQFWINSRVNYPFYDLSILSPPSPSFCLPVGHLPSRWRPSHDMEKELMLHEMQHASIKHKMYLWKSLIVLDFLNLDLN